MTEREKQEQFLVLFEPVRDRLYRFARMMTADSEEARDLVGDTVLLVYEHFESIRSKEAFLSYVFTVASRLFRRRKWRGRIFDLLEDWHTDQLRSHETTAEHRIDIQLLYTALDKLPVKQRECIVLFEILGFSIEEIRAIQGGSPSGVKTRLMRGRQALARLLGVDDMDRFQARARSMSADNDDSSEDHNTSMTFSLGRTQ